MNDAWTEDEIRDLADASQIMLDDNVPHEQAVQLLATAHAEGKSLVEFARHFVELRKAARGE